jgi:DNA-binding response OmpR family regulator
MSMARILVIDDDSLILRLVQLMLVTEGHEVDTAGDGVEGLRILNSHPPDAIVLDMTMPQMDGETFFKVLTERGCTAPIIIFSALESSAKAQQLGAAAYLQKPFDPDNLQSVINEVLQRSNSQGRERQRQRNGAEASTPKKWSPGGRS